MTILNVKAEIEIPRVPNFIRRTDGVMMAVGDFTDDGLREMAVRWTENLLERAKEQREDRKGGKP